MSRGDGKLEGRFVAEADVPRGTPAWISIELIDHTIAVWQPYYARPLTVDDAIGIIEGTGRLLEMLS
jgi:hypothetical protein